MSLQYDEMSPGSPSDVLDHPDHNHSELQQLAGDVIDKSSYFSAIKTYNNINQNDSHLRGVKTPSTNAPVIKLPTVVRS